MHDLATFDEAALRRLSYEVDDRAFTWLFASRYRRMLIGRVARITTALQRLDIEAALDAALSLKVASATVGTCELADLAHEVEARRAPPGRHRRRTAASRLWPAAVRADQRARRLPRALSACGSGRLLHAVADAAHGADQPGRAAALAELAAQVADVDLDQVRVGGPLGVPHRRAAAPRGSTPGPGVRISSVSRSNSVRVSDELGVVDGRRGGRRRRP